MTISQTRPPQTAAPSSTDTGTFAHILSPVELQYCAEAAAGLGVPSRVVAAFCERLGSRPELYGLAERLAVLGIIREGEPELRSAEALLARGIDAQTFSALLTTCRAFPVSDGSRTFTHRVAESGLLSAEAVDPILMESTRAGVSTIQFLGENGLVAEAALSALLTEFSGIQYANEYDVVGAPAPLAPAALGAVLALDLIPWRTEDGRLLVLSERPVMHFVLAALEKVLGGLPEIRLVTPARAASLLTEIVRQSGGAQVTTPTPPVLMPTASAGLTAPSSKPTVAPELGHTNRLTGAITPVIDPAAVTWLPAGPIADSVRNIIQTAMDRRATDVHFDPFRDYLRVRIRVDGILHELYRIDNAMRREVLARIKILADLDITERRRAQDGQISMQISGSPLDLRVATIPVKHGERVELRLANMIKAVDDLESLGLEGVNAELVRGFLTQPHGIILATGPVGSGKTTSLYSCLSKLDSSSYNIMSIEDPVEVDIDGVNQVNVNYKINFDFVAGLRGLLRHDPDIILIGEIRDEETAKIAVRAAMPRMLVFSSLHTNTAPGAVTTLYNFHLPPHLVANGLLGVIAQRLVRRNCPHCSQSYAARQKELDYLFRDNPDDAPESATLMRGSGCGQCLGSGYLGRVGVFEVLAVTPKIRDMITDECSEREIRDAAIERDMITLAVDARQKVLAGQTSVSEIARVLGT